MSYYVNSGRNTFSAGQIEKMIQFVEGHPNAFPPYNETVTLHAALNYEIQCPDNLAYGDNDITVSMSHAWLKSGNDLDWTVSSTSGNVSIVDNGVDASLTVNNSTQGTATIYCNVESDGRLDKVYTKTININPQPVAPTINPPYDYGCMCYEHYNLTPSTDYMFEMVSNCTSDSDSDYEWNYRFNSDPRDMWRYKFGEQTDINTIGGGTMHVRARYRENGEWSYWSEVKSYEVSDNGMMVLLSPNPATSETELTVYNSESKEAYDEWNYEVYDSSLNFKDKKVKIKKQKTVKIKTNGWRTGSYYVIVYTNEEKKAMKLQINEQ